MKYFDDEHEGDLGNNNIEFHNFMQHVLAHKDRYFELRQGVNSELRDTLHINCWHVAKKESPFMWAEYCKKGNGVAIMSKYTKLVKALNVASEVGFERSTNGDPNDHCVQIGRVKYVNYDEAFIPEDSLWSPFLHKRKKYSRENELRCMILHGYESRSIVEKYGKGTNVVVDLGSLIDRLYISPHSDQDYINRVLSLTESANLKVEIVRSQI